MTGMSAAIDGNQLIMALSHTFHHDADLRNQAVKHLADLEASLGARILPVLFDVVSEDRLQLAVRQAAALRVKCIITHRFARRRDQEAPIDMSDSDLAIIRSKMLSALFATASTRSLRVQLLVALHTMIRVEFPARWPDLLACILPHLADTTCAGLAALHILRLVYKRYQHSNEKNDPVLTDLLACTLQPIEAILTRDLQTANDLDALERAKLCLKMYHHAIRQPMPAAVQESASFMRWSALCLSALSIVPCEAMDDQLALIKSLQKRALICMIPLLHLYGRTIESQDLSDKEFSALYVKQIAPRLLDAILHIMQRPTTLVSRQMLQSSFSFLGCALTHASLYARLRPHLKTVLIDGVFRTMCLTPDEVDLFEEDGAEFTRRGLDASEAFDDPRINAVNVLLDMVRVRTSDILQPLLEFITAQLARTEDMVCTDGALSMFGSLSRVLLADPAKILPVVHQIVFQSVVPLLSSGNGILRARAAWVCGRYAALPNADQYIGIVFNLLRSDPCVPVVAAASIAFSELLAKHADAIEQLKVHLPVILEQYVGLIDTVGNESVISVLEDLVARFPPVALAPFSSRLVEKLLTVFAASAFCVTNDDDTDEEKQFIAMSAIRVIVALVSCCRDAVNDASLAVVYRDIERQCTGVIEKLLEESNVMLLESALDLLHAMTDISPLPLSPFLQSMPARLCAAVEGHAADYINAMMPALRNIMARNGAFYASDDPQHTIRLCAHVLEGEDAVHEGKYAAQILVGLVAFCPTGPEHQAVRQAVVAEVTRLTGQAFLIALPQSGEDFTFEVFCSLLLNVVAHCARVDPVVFLQTTAATPLLSSWIAFIPTLTWEFAEAALVGITSLLTIPSSTPTAEQVLVLGAVPALCCHIAIEAQDDLASSEDEAEPGQKRGLAGGLRDVAHNEDWNSQADEDDDYDYNDEDEDGFFDCDEGAQLPEINLQKLFIENLNRFPAVQAWQATLASADQQSLQMYCELKHYD